MSDNKGMLKKRSGLGKGLGALLSDAPALEENNEQSLGVSGVAEIPIRYIETNPYQPRQDFDEEAILELAESIRVHGIIQPITVRKLNDTAYQLISGERRWQASKRVGLESIPAYVRTANDQQMLEMALIENIQRENLNPIEIALSYQRLIAECSLKQEELGDRVGKKRSTVTNYLRLLRLLPQVQAALRDGTISMGHARSLVNIESADLQLSIYHRIVEEALSVRKVEEIVRDIFQGKEEKSAAPKPAPAELDGQMRSVQTDLASYFSTRVKLKAHPNGKGEISIPFESIDDLNRILEIIRH